MAKEIRNYTIKDVDMLITSSIIIETAIKNKVFLISKRNAWADPFFDDLKIKIDKVIKDNLGVDSAAVLRKITAKMRVLQTDARKSISEFKVQIDSDFKKEPVKLDEILNLLGFTNNLKNVQNGSQEALISLLYHFKTNLDTTLKTEIVKKGTNQSLIDTIINFAEIIKDTDISQETAKSGKKTTTANYVSEFNNVYDEVIGVAKIAANFCKDNPTLKQQFSFNKISKALSASKEKPSKPAKSASKEKPSKPQPPTK